MILNKRDCFCHCRKLNLCTAVLDKKQKEKQSNAQSYTHTVYKYKKRRYTQSHPHYHYLHTFSHVALFPTRSLKCEINSVSMENNLQSTTNFGYFTNDIMAQADSVRKGIVCIWRIYRCFTLTIFSVLKKGQFEKTEIFILFFISATTSYS